MAWMDAEAKFEEALDGFEPRENQRALATSIEGSLAEGHHLLARAGCGTGKSYAGVLPAIEHSKKTRKPVLYVTATKALQDQLATKDLPFLQTIFDFTSAVLKGRSNYVCLQKVDEMEGYQKGEIQKLVMSPTFSGEVGDLPNGAAVASQVTTTSEECPGKKECPFGEICFAERAKEKAKDANIVVVNHAVLAADLSIKAKQEAIGIPADKVRGILPQFSGVVVDEGHELEEYVTSALGDTITAGAFGRLANEISNFLGTRDAVRELGGKADAVFTIVRRSLDQHRKDPRHKFDKQAPFTADTLNALADPVFDLINVLVALDSQVVDTAIYNDDKKAQQRTRLDKRTMNLVEKLRDLMTADFTQLVRWMTVAEGKKGETIEWAPLTVSDFLYENLWAKVPSIVMSATLDFDMHAERLGLDQVGVKTFDAGTPFNFEQQARMFVPQIAAPDKAGMQQWRGAYVAMAGELIRAANGRALFLFTSKSEMEDAHMRLAPMIKSMGHLVLKQGEQPNKDLARIFKDDEHSVLFAMKSFFTGVDVQGDSLRLLIINKLTFIPPTDIVFKARCDAIDKGGNPFAKGGSFWKLSVPIMSLTLEQGLGRLIRTVHDRGLLACMDSRLFGKNAKSYGGVVMNQIEDAFPGLPVITSLDDATGYLKTLEVAA
jgi:ATP-dependent DNA helicase DinG